MIQFTDKEVLVRIKDNNPQEKAQEIQSGIIAAIRGLTQPGKEPMTPARSEAIYTLTELLEFQPQPQ